MNRLKNPPGWVLLALLAVLTAGGAAGSLWAAGTRPDPVWQGFWGGVSTTCIGTFGTVFLVNQLLRRVEERRRTGLALHVRQRVSRIAFYETDMLKTMVREHPLADSEAQRQSRRDVDGINRIPDGFAARVDETIDGIGRRLARLDAGDWAAFGRSFDRSALEYARVVSLFGYEMDAEVLRLVLRAEESAHRLSGVVADRAGRFGQERGGG